MKLNEKLRNEGWTALKENELTRYPYGFSCNLSFDEGAYFWPKKCNL